jgi:tetratricopeptide (TPR) repeat protein
LGRLDEAAQQYQSILDGDPNHGNAWLGLGQIAYKRCDLDNMTQAFERAAALESENPIFRALPGAAYAARGALEQQAQVYFNLGQDFPTDPLALIIAGEYAWQQGDVLAAREKLDQAAQASQLPPVLQSQINYDLGLISLLQNELPEAEEQFRLALEASPANAASLTALGDIFLLRGDAVQALEAHELALELLPGYALQFSGEGADLLEVSLQARRALALARLGQTAEAAQVWGQAEDLGERLVDIFPNWPQAHKSLGSVYYLMGDDSRANAEFTHLAACDAGLEKSNPVELAYLKQLR